MGLQILVTVEDSGLFDRCRECGFDARLERPGKLVPARLRKEFPDVVLAAPGDLERLISAEFPYPPAFIACLDSSRPELGLRALDAGASDVLWLPASTASLQLTVSRALRLRSLENERDALRQTQAHESSAILSGGSRAATRLHDSVLRVAATPGTTVLLRAEPHGGASAIARAVHFEGKHAKAPMAELDCRAENCPLELEDSSLFRAIYRSARGGTLHIAEVGSLGRTGQARLLQILEGRSSELSGGSTEDWGTFDPRSVRIIASTSDDLDQLSERGEFNEDLLYRLNVLVISVPPLRERKEDLAGLARALFSNLSKIPPAEAFTQLRDEDLADNLASLRAFVLGHGSVEKAPAAFGLDLPHDDYSVKSAERALIELVLERTGGNRSEAARLLEVNRTTLYNKLRAYGL